MKTILLMSLFFLSAFFCSAQTPKDTVMLDSSDVERIHKMPMDTFNSKMPVAPLERDSTINRNRTRDDADPKKMKDSLRYKE